MERRFGFKSPSAPELFLSLWGKPLLALALAVCIVLNPFSRLDFSFKVVVALLTFAIASLIFWRSVDIGRRDEQARHGFIELTADELCISPASNSLLCVPWPDFARAEQKHGWLYLHFYDTENTQTDASQTFVRVRSAELETPDAIVEALHTRTQPN